MYFNSKNYKLLRYIYRHPNVCEGTLKEKFGPDISWTLISLVKEGYLGGENPDGLFLVFDEPPYSTTADTMYSSLPRGDLVVEDKRWELWKWLIPLIFSSISLALSIVNLILRG